MNFNATYEVSNWCLSYPGLSTPCEASGPLDIISNRFPVARMGATLTSSEEADGAFRFTPWIVPEPPTCEACNLVLGGFGHYLGTESNGYESSPFDGLPTARLRLRAEEGSWVLDQEAPTITNPEPSTLLLLGFTLALIGMWMRKHASR